MIKKIATIICAFVAIANAYEPVKTFSQNLVPQLPETKMMPTEPGQLKEGLLYVRFLAADPSVFTQYQVHPGVGVGYRRMKGSSAFDILGTMGGRGGHKRDAYTWTLPKVSYLHYLNPLSDQTMYLGAGMAFGGVESKRVVIKGHEVKTVRHEFVGLLGHVTVGAEWFRKDACVVMSELSVSQPLVPANNPKGISGPSAELSCGLGF